MRRITRKTHRRRILTGPCGATMAHAVGIILPGGYVGEENHRPTGIGVKPLLLVLIVITAVAAAPPRATDAATTTKVAAVGDMCGSRCDRTADLVSRNNPALVLALGDEAYPSGTLNQFRNNYHPYWGAFNAMMKPAPGNHEYESNNASGYREYFGFSSTKRLYHSFDRGGWHFVQYDTERMSSTQIDWIRSDLAADASQCEIAYGHRPRWSSGKNGSLRTLSGLWNTLDNANVDIVLNGHDHDYERIYRDGVREFVVGTGGESLTAFSSRVSGSQFRYNSTYGVLFLTLGSDATYSWQFRAVSGSVVDSGAGICH
jgi:hypothetical protein